MNEDSYSRQADLEIVRGLEKINADLGHLPPPPSPEPEKPSALPGILIAIVLTVAAFLLAFLPIGKSL